MTLRFSLLLSLLTTLYSGALHAQPCLNGWNLTANPPPTNGTYASGETVTFCFTVTGWNTTNANWFHGVAATFGPGWDMSTLVPGTPPPTCGTSGGTWGWFNSVQGTSGSNIGPQGPGFFFDLNNDGIAGNNFGDFCTGSQNWQFCWTISVVSGADCNNGLNLGMSVNSFSDSQTGSWGSVACTNDPIVPSTPAVTECCDADAGTDGTINLCSTSPPTNLATALGGTPDAGGTWTGPDGAVHPGVIVPAADLPGNYTYTVVNAGANCEAEAVVTVTIVDQPIAGTNGTVTACTSDAAFALFDLLGGTPSVGGTWSAPGGGAFSGTFDPASNPGGVYTYTVNAPPPCMPVSSTVTVTVNPTPTAGTNGAVAFCSNGQAADLFTALGGTPDAGGAWSDPAGAPFGGVYDPAVNSPGVFTYTVQGVAPCANSSATVTVTENLLPNAGSNGSASFCETAAPVNLITVLGGSPQPGGTWTAPGGGAMSGTLDPGTAQAGIYTYTITGQTPCPNASATATITIVSQPDAGTNGTVNLCDGSPATNLFNGIGGSPDAGGTWTAPGGQAFGGTFTPGIDTPGAYTYTIPATPPCVNVSATVTVNLSPQPNAGTSATLGVCSSDPATELISLLGPNAQVGGSWTVPGGAAGTGVFTPGTSVDGVYTYTIAGVAPCITTSATVTVTTTAAANPGTNATFATCVTGPAVDLFPELGGAPSPGGAWTTPAGTPFNGNIDPATAASGIHTYTLPANGPCPAASATVDVTIIQAPNAGTNGTVNLCSSPTQAYPLVSGLGGSPQPGGTWTGPTGQPVGGNFTPGTSATGVYTYTVGAPPPCTSVSSTVTVTVVQAPNPGSGSPVTLCQTGAAVNPNTWLGGNPDAGGTWTNPAGGTVVTVDPATAASGTYTYTVAGVAPCPAASTTVQLTVAQPPNAGTNGNVSLCSAPAQAYQLINGLGGAPQAGGTWTGPTGQPTGPDFTPGTSTPGTYTYTVNAPPPCTAASSTVTVSVVQASNAGIGGQITLCETATPLDPAGWLAGNPDAGGVWTDPAGNVVTTIDPAMAPSGNYTYTVAGVAPCPNVQATVNLVVSPLPNAGNNAVLQLCADASPTALFNSLGGADQGGTWTGPSGPSNGSFVPGTSAQGTYTYTVNGTGGCVGTMDEATVTVSVVPLPVPAFQLSPASGCAPLQAQFTLNDPAGIQAATWSFGDGNLGGGSPTVFHTYGAGGTYSVLLTVTDGNGCIGSTLQSNAVLVSQGPEAFFVPSPLVISVEDPEFNVVHEPQPGIEYAWTVDGAAIEGGSNFSYNIPTTDVGYYPICLVATDALGCSNEFCVEILVDDVLTVFVPNAFTPDGNGINDEFRPSLLGMDPERYLFIIFDRWGAEIFSTNDPYQGWNGAYRNNGQVLPQGVYVWRLLVRDQFTTDQREYIGSVTLLK
jgi:gliding motility-associated-like protein